MKPFDAGNRTDLRPSPAPLWFHLCKFLLLVAWATPQSSVAQPFCSAPRITNQPTSLIVLEGSPAGFSVGLFYEGCAFTYNWLLFDANILGGTNPTWGVSYAQPNKVGEYRVIVSNVSGMATSSVATLTVVSGPRPYQRSVLPGSDVTFTVTVTGFGPAQYQWQFNGEDLPDATNPILTLTNAQPSQAGAYSVTVSNPAGTVTTPAATLRVDPPPLLSCPLLDANGLRFLVRGASNATYVIQSSYDLLQWTNRATMTAPADGTVEFIELDTSNPGGRFYRAVQP